MAIVEVKVPQLSESVAEATLLQWKKRPGEAVEIDEILVEIETDKVVLEVPAPAAGVMAQIIKNDGESCTAEEVIARIDTEAAAQTSPLEVKAVPVAAAPAAPAPAAPAPAAMAGVAMPSAAKLMADNQLPTGSVQGTGKDGRVTKGDVLVAIEPGAKAPAAPAVPPSTTAPPRPPAAPARPTLQAVAAPPAANLGDRPEQRVPMSRLRARVAERLLQSQSTNAILTTFNEVNMAPLMEMRKRFQEKFEKEHGVKIGFMSFFVKAAVHALKKFPVINASVDGTDIVYHGYFDIGIAVGSPRGLVVPILRNADQMSFADIEKKIAEYGAKARDGKLMPHEYQGGTASLSNMGMYGIKAFDAVINPPQAMIMAIGAGEKRPYVIDDALGVATIMSATGSFDHRAIDGADGARLMSAFKALVETPLGLVA